MGCQNETLGFGLTGESMAPVPLVDGQRALGGLGALLQNKKLDAAAADMPVLKKASISGLGIQTI
jgi:hypothetical protein